MKSYRCQSRDIEIPMEVIEDLAATERSTPYNHRAQNFGVLSGRTSNSSLFRPPVDSKTSPRFPLLSPKSSQSFGSYSPRRSLAGPDRVPLTVLRGYVLREDRNGEGIGTLPPVANLPFAATAAAGQKVKVGRHKKKSQSKRSRWVENDILIEHFQTWREHHTRHVRWL